MVKPRRTGAARLASPARLTLVIEKLVKGGLGLARHEGQVVLVEDAARGDRVIARVLARKRDYLLARVEEVLEPGLGRREPPCPHARRCGGCSLQHLDYPTQVASKLEVLRETLERVGRLALPGEVRVHESPEWGQRLRARLHHRRGRPGRAILGFVDRSGREVVDIGPCPVLVPEIESRLDELRARIGEARRGAGEVSVLAADAGLLSTLDGAPGVLEAAGESYAVSPHLFFQANRALLPRLIARVRELALSAGDLDVAYDLYAGVGLFTLPLARVFPRVVAMEERRSAVDLLRVSASRAGLTSIEARAVEVEAGLSSLAGMARAAVVADPPRPGLTAVVRSQLVRLRPSPLVLVSCDPAAAARDLRALVDGGFALRSVDLFDLFPQTAHVETVALLHWPE